MKEKVAITGMGIVSAIGMNAEENFLSLKDNKHGISKIAHIETTLKDKILVGEIKKSNQELESLLNLPSKNNFSRSSMLGAIAAKEAVQSAGISTDGNTSIGFINSTTVGGRSEEHTSELQSRPHLVCRLLLEKKNKKIKKT